MPAAPHRGMGDAEVRAWLRETDPAQLDRLFAAADAVRRDNVGEAVHLRGLVEISNACVRSCA
jgi:biotin synthase